MKRLFVASVIASLFVASASMSWAETTTVKSSKSNSSDRVAGKEEGQQKKAKSTAAAAAQSQQDPCASVKNDPTKYEKCQEATKPAGLKDIKGAGKRY